MGQQRLCPATGLKFEITDTELAHIERMGLMHPSIAEPLPLPIFHPYELIRRLYCFGNLTYLYQSRSSLSGNSQLSRYNEKDNYKICTLEEFWSEKVDNTEFGSSYNFKCPFFDQWHELSKRCFLPPLNNRNVEGSDYVNGTVNIKNCYLCFDTLESQDCLYCLIHLKGDCNLDCVGTTNSELCYSCVDTDRCYECDHCQDSNNCSFCFACIDCIGCRNCIGCIGLRNCEYYIFNQAVTRNDYELFLNNNSLQSRIKRSDLLRQCKLFHQQSAHRINRIKNSENCTGNYILNSKNLFECYHAGNSQDCGYLLLAYNSRDCWRGYGWNSELSYQSGSTGSSCSYYSYSDFNGENNLYCYMMFNRNQHCFGCVGLKSKSYCILNKQYTKQEYFELLPQIIEQMKYTGEWGNYFPPDVAPHAQNESIGSILIEDLDPTKLMTRGYRIAPQQPITEHPNSIPAEQLPDDINSIDINNFVNRPITCLQTKRLFNFQTKELQFYKQRNIPLPQIHWRERLFKLTSQRQLLPAV